ncbi:hypothetical protein [Bradyrhizobium sp. JYMT SZCCT0428]|uniref:hypothetical protein n=1 Tax=Bradyrhizobium sp. JYMT SZCCT0428 TaxID=2807673 RepID=UPI001BADB1F7|nr:hypothetical protein [Bradyrhizobium sp. JYMT SZCCT0428]MBR1157042.1 hypothetical protein [Bradyrhizobium sp. JYMT SZCCT0428]
MASGHMNRIKRPNTWLQRPMLQNREESSCQTGAVHTWHFLGVRVQPDDVGYRRNYSGIVSPTMRMAICAMLVFMLIQNTCAFVLVGAGEFVALARRASITLVGMALISALMFFCFSGASTRLSSLTCLFMERALAFRGVSVFAKQIFWEESSQPTKLEHECLSVASNLLPDDLGTTLGPP